MSNEISQHEYDVQSPEFFRDPYPTFRRMRVEAPVYHVKSLGIWMLTRYDHIEAMVRDPRFSSRRTRELLGAAVSGPEGEAMLAQWSKLVFFLDAPRQPRIKAFLQKPLAHVHTESLRPMVTRVVRKALGAVLARREMDVAVDLADPIALDVLMELFDLPEADRPNFRAWTTDILKPAGLGAPTEELIRRVRQSSASLFEYILSLTAERRRRPGRDMISHLLSAAEGDEEMIQEVGQQCANTVAAGYLTSANQISNAVLAFLNHPAELARLRADPSLLKTAVEEVIRFDPAVLSISRLTLEEAQIGGVTIPRGQLVFGLTSAANRDPAVTYDPDRFDISRKSSRHLGFGSGAHYCLGSSLIRLEVEEVLRAMLELPDWRFGDRPHEYSSFHLQDRGPKSLPMRWGAA